MVLSSAQLPVIQKFSLSCTMIGTIFRKKPSRCKICLSFWICYREATTTELFRKIYEKQFPFRHSWTSKHSSFLSRYIWWKIYWHWNNRATVLQSWGKNHIFILNKKSCCSKWGLCGTINTMVRKYQATFSQALLQYMVKVVIKFFLVALPDITIINSHGALLVKVITTDKFYKNLMQPQYREIKQYSAISPLYENKIVLLQRNSCFIKKMVTFVFQKNRCN